MQKIKAHKQAFRRALRILYWVGLMILYLCAASRPGVWLPGCVSVPADGWKLCRPG